MTDNTNQQPTDPIIHPDNLPGHRIILQPEPEQEPTE